MPLAPNRGTHAAAVDIRRLEEDLRRSVDGEVRFDTASRAIYATDASNYRQAPVGVVIPRTKEAVIATVALCREHHVPLLNRGGGTALAGQSCNAAVLIDFSKYLHHVLKIDPERKLARVEPGTNLDDLRHAAEQHHLTFGPDPATHNHCTLGGMIGNNSCGIHSVMAGRTADNVEELEIVTYDGLRLSVGKTSDAELEVLMGEGGRRGEIYRRLKALRDKYAGEIRTRYPKIPRRVSGYNLDELLPENGFHVARALVGSESTCVTVLEATLRLVHSPPVRSLLVLGYPDVYSAADHVPEIMACGPIGLEGVDNLLVEFMKRKGVHTGDIALLPPGQGWLIVEFGGESKEEADARAGRCMAELKKAHQPPSMKLYDDKREEAEVWEIRESGLGATANVPGLPLTWPGWEDSAVDPKNLGRYLRDFRQLLERYEYQASLYGHFGQGCLHCRISFDMMTARGVQKYIRFIHEAADLVVKYNGSLSGEHGDGQSRAMLLPKMFGPELMEAFREFKAIWDPEGKMNPKKVIEPYRADENLRLGGRWAPWTPETHFQFPEDDHSFARATLRCVGVGKCRRTANAFMCPSYLATREELHTTRGRARMLFEMFQRDVLRDGWRSREVKEALDLCLACKGCKRECPINVDMASYKAEFLSHYYEHRLRPREHYSMGWIGTWAALGSKMPALANFMGNAWGIGRITKALAGIHPKRPMPRFARVPFTEWFRRRGPGHREGEAVVLYPDAFNNHFFPDTLKAMVEVLETMGFQVALPRGDVSAIRPLIHYGFLRAAKRKLRDTLGMLHDWIATDTPILFAEPSTAAVFRDDLPGLMPADEDGRRMQRLALLLGEFIEERQLAVPRLDGRAIYHGHCHQKAVLRPKAAKTVLERMGLEYVEPQQGCCGMAGSFGFESRHYDLSQQIGEQQLLPAVREADPDVYIVADGFSCRTQILDGTGRRALHLAELLKRAYQTAGKTA